jgi:hypothetical protein
MGLLLELGGSVLSAANIALEIVVSAPQTATPVFSPVAGTYGSGQTVTITCSTPGPTIYYTTDGTTPTTISPIYVNPIVISTTTQLKAIATATGYTQSNVQSGTYTITGTQCATPTSSPASGTYATTQTVTLSCSTPVSTIYYTVNGTQPTTSSPIYSSPLTVSATETIKAIATASGFTQSNTLSATYTITAAQAGTPTFSPVGGSYTTTQTVTIFCTSPSPTIYYTTNGTTPTTGSTVYTGPFTVSATETIKAIATSSGLATSNVGTANYIVGATLYDGVIKISGSKVVNNVNQTLQLRGANFSGLENSAAQGQTPDWADGGYLAPNWSTYATWAPNIVRIPLNALSFLAQTGYLTTNVQYFQILSGTITSSGGTLVTAWPLTSGTYPISLNGIQQNPLTVTCTNGSNVVGALSSQWTQATGNYSIGSSGLSALMTLGSTTVGNLPSNWTQASGTYGVNFSANAGPLTTMTATNGSTAVTWGRIDQTGNNTTPPAVTVSGNSVVYCTAIGWGASRAADFNGTYKATIQTAISNARANNCYIIFDLHWTAPQMTIGGVTNYLMPLGQSAFIDTTGQAFWTAFYNWLVATYGAGNFQDMVFELYNEPYLNQNGYYITTTSGGTTSVAANVAIGTGAWSSCLINQSQGGTNYILGYSWQVIGYQTIATALRGLGCTNILLTNGNDYSQQLQNYAQWKITDSLNQTGYGWHPYPAGSPNSAGVYPNGNVWPRIGSDSGGNTNLAFQWANAILAAGYPVFITEYGGISGVGVTTLPQEQADATLDMWARVNNVPAVAWEFTATRSYGTTSPANGGPYLTVRNSAGNAVLPITGHGYTVNKYMTRAKAPMTCLTRSGITGQASSGTTTTMTDSLANWLTNQWVGATFVDNFTGQSGAITANTANTLTFSAISTAVAANDGYSILTAQIVPYVNNAQYPAANVTNPSGNVIYQSTSTMPSYVAFDLTNFINSGGNSIYLAWYNDYTYDYNAYAVNPGNPYYNVPGSYTIDVNTAASGTYPTTGWTTLYTVTGNNFNRAHFLVAMGTNNWVRLNCTVINGGSGNNRLGLKMDLYDASYGATDGLFIAGDSITANGMAYNGTSKDSISNYACGQLGTQTTTASSLGCPGYYNGYPLPYINGGMAGWTTSNYLAVFSSYLSIFPGLYVGLALGTNDLPTGSGGVSTYTSNMTNMINQIIAAGKIPLLATMVYSPDTNESLQHSNGYVAFWPAENALLQLGGVVPGPNFRKFFYGYVSIAATGPVGSIGSGSNGITGVSSSAGNTTITDTTQYWANNVHTNFTLNNLTRGTVSTVISNTSNTITFANPPTAPQAGDIYNLTYQNYTATGGSMTTLTDTTQAWPTNLYQYSYVCNVTRGTYAQVLSNNANTLTFAAMSTANQSGDIYSLNGQNMVTYGIDGSDGLHPGTNGQRGQRILWAQAIAAAGVT